MRVLVVTYSFPPAESPRAHRWGRLADAFSSKGVQVDIIAAGSATAELTLPSGVRVFSVVPGVVQATRERILRNSAKNATGGARPPWVSLGREVVRRAVRAMRWPDYSASWVRPALRLAQRLVQQEHYDGLISVSLPFGAHLVAKELRRGGSFHGTWIVDVGDPFSLADNSSQGVGRVFLARSQRAERSVLHSCDRWAVTDRGARDALVGSLRVSGDKAVVIPPLLPPFVRLRSSSDIAPLSSRGRLRMAYAGIFYDSIRPVERLAKLTGVLLDELGADGFVVDVFGDNDYWKQRLFASFPGMSPYVRFLGSLNRSDLLPRLADYDVLLNFGNSTTFQVPSKIVEYGALGVPLLNVKGRTSDTSELLLEGYSRAQSILVPDLADSDAWQVPARESLRSFLSREWPADTHDVTSTQWLSTFSLETVSSQYLRALV